ncbi:hypothetical protein Neosp_013575 [[Neocosmospora] mangrovei]
MALIADVDGKHILFTWGLFGIQSRHSEDNRNGLIEQLHKLLSQSAGRVDRLQDASQPGIIDKRGSTVFIAYWLSCQDYQSWRDGVFRTFWDSLPDDAGVWREIMTVPKSRYEYSSTAPPALGFASLVGLTPTTDVGYWGVHRHRMAQQQDKYTYPGDTFTSPYTSKVTDPRKLVDLEKEYPDVVHKGRLAVTKIPDNLCFIREYQAQPNLPKEELDLWSETLGPYFEAWVKHLRQARNKNGTVSFSTYLSTESDPKFGPIPRPQSNQLMYFLDLEAFELSGRASKDHVKMRNATMEAYGPGGKLFGLGKLHLVVEIIGG